MSLAPTRWRWSSLSAKDLRLSFGNPSERHVTFTSYLRGSGLARAYASADVFIITSVTETFGKAVVEAMARGLPVVALDARGVRDTVRHDVAGLLAPVSDTSSFVRLVERALGDGARTWVGRQRWPAVMEELLAVYNRVIAHAQERRQRSA